MPNLESSGATAPIAIKISGLRKSFGEHEVLKGVSMTARQGDVVAIIGGSGSGKSTLLRCINFLETPSGGSIEVGGEPIDMKADGSAKDKKQLEKARQSLGMVFQNFNLWTHMTVLENLIEVPVHVLKTPKAEAIARARALLARVGLEEKEAAYPAFLSGGQQQRAAIARALCMNPKAMLFDEPTSALDPISTLKIEELIDELKRDFTIAIVTHNMQQASRVSDETAFFSMDDDRAGYIVETGPTAEMFTNPKQALTEGYIQGRFG